jgi:hypothetical protein
MLVWECVLGGPALRWARSKEKTLLRNEPGRMKGNGLNLKPQEEEPKHKDSTG